MAGELEAEADRVIRFVLGDLADWKRPDVLKSIGKSHLELFDAFESELAELREAIRQILTARYSAEELASEFPDSDARNPLLQVAGPFGALARRIARAKISAPQDFVGGWSIRGREIDLEHWRAIPSFSIVEVTLLSIGRDPRHTNFDALFATYGRSDQADEMLYDLEDRQEQLARAFGHDPDDAEARIEAAAFLKWVRERHIGIDSRFRRMLSENWSSEATAKVSIAAISSSEDKTAHLSSRRAFARLLTALAIQRYKLTSVDRIGAVSRQMESDSHLSGVSVNAKTVRDLLRLGWKQLSEEVKNERMDSF